MLNKARVFYLINLLLIILACAAACGRSSSQTARNGEIPDGAIVVENPLRPLFPDRSIRFEEELTIGVREGDENAMFGSRIAVNADDRGRFYVSDIDKKIVRCYDEQGRYLLDIGRPGQGPGEFGDIGRVRFDGGGNIYLHDAHLQRITFMDRDGGYLRTVKTPPAFGDVIINSKGLYLARGVDNLELGKGKKWDVVHGLFDDGFQLAVEFRRRTRDDGAYSKNTSPARLFADYFSETAFRPGITIALDRDDRIFFGDPETYVIRVYSPEGRPRSVFRREYRPVRIGARHRKYFRNHLDRSALVKMPPSEEADIFDLIEYPEFLPAYERFVLMDNGWIFVIQDSTPEDYAWVDIFDRDGKFLMRFKTDIAVEGLVFADGKAYAVATVDDYKYVKRYSYRTPTKSSN